ncbi:hypothetical protein ACFQVD_26345 [Streptosporangium amethystogenes subsp. fukuiense]|uniref:CcmD family protein n=1 Tax=Streptosporangium amethystogenes subsp. fukuiense TaxID=698418 RepID=A0ABW2T7D4_9ACTN
MSDDAFWALVNVGVLVATLAGYAVVLSLNARANRRQFERLTRRYGRRP